MGMTRKRELDCLRQHDRHVTGIAWVGCGVCAWIVVAIVVAVATIAVDAATAQVPAAPPPLGAFNTTVVPRTAPELNANQSQISLSAFVTEDGQMIDQGVTWRVYRTKPEPDGKLPLVTQSRDAGPVLKLDPGEYAINAAFGRANLTRRVTLVAGKSTTERFVLNAGGLRLNAVLASGEPAPEKSVVYDVLSEDRDQFGQRTKVLGGAKPGLIIRLNAGLYRIVSTYGDANATVYADLAVEPGKLTEATVTHTAAKVTLKLVTKAGGEAIADTQWSITGPSGDVIKDSVGALPSHILAAGNYAVTAKYGTQSYRRDFGVKGGDVVVVELVAR
jgi:hypothetical protein